MTDAATGRLLDHTAPSDRPLEPFEFLSQAVALLAASLDDGAILATLARLAVPAYADWCSVHVVGEDGQPCLAAHAQVGVPDAEEIRQRFARYPTLPGQPLGVSKVLRTGEPDLHAELDDAELARSARDAEHLALLRTLRPRSVLIVPLKAHGRIHGSLTWSILGSNPRRYTARDLAFAQDLAHVAALAVDNARALRAEQRAREAAEQQSSERGRAEAEAQRELGQRRRVELALRASEATFRQLFEVNPLPMWVFDRDSLRILEVNEAAVAHYGYPRAEFLALRLTDLRPPEDVPALLSLLRTSRGPFRSSGPHRHRRKDGTIIHVEIASHLLDFGGLNAALVVARDVTDRLQAEAALRRQTERYGALLRAQSDLGEGVVIRDGDRIVYANEAMARLTGYSIDELLALDSYLQIIAPEHRDQARDRARRRQGGEPADSRFEQSLLRRDGAAVPVEVVAKALDIDGRPQVISIVRDISERRRLEEQLRQAQKMEAVGRLAGGVAHDFNNIMGVILGYAELLLSRTEPEDPRRLWLEQISQAATRATGLTRQLLAFSRRQILQPRPIDVNAALLQLEKILRRLIGEDIELVLTLAPRLEAVCVDPSQFDQVLINLAVNARDAMPGGGTLSIETGMVRRADPACAGTDEPRLFVRIAVRDTGVGMDAATVARIFEPFFTTKDPSSGSGLGLATVYAIVQQCGGQIEVSSRPGSGTSFAIYLPVSDENVEAAQPAEEARSDRGHETVLIAEDEPRLRSLMVEVLQLHGYHVLAAPDGVAALELAAGHTGSIDALVTDVVMPRLGGRELVERLRELRPGLRVLYVSGYNEDVVLRHGVACASERLLQKPFKPAALAHAVRQMLDAHPV